MKEFENENWELKARRLADAFQPAPDQSVWLNVEAALSQKKNRKRIFFWLFSFIAVAVVVYGGVTLYILNAGDQNESLNKQYEKSKVENVAANINPSDVVDSLPIVNEQKTEPVVTGKIDTENSSLKFQEQKNNSSIGKTEEAEIKTVVKKNELEEKPDFIVTDIIDSNIIKSLNPFAFCGLNFKQGEWRTPPPALFPENDFNKKDFRWMLFASTSKMKQRSILNSNDTLQTFEKQNTSYIDGSLQLIYQFQKARNLEMKFGFGFYELNQNYTSTKEQIVSSFDTISGAPLISTNKLTEYLSGSEFSRNLFFDFGIGIPVIVYKNFNWNFSAGIRNEYLIKYSSTSGATIPNTFGNLGLQYLESVSTNEQNRFCMKGMLNTSIRYALSKHFVLQSGINSAYSFTDRYKKSSVLHQRDLNFGINTGLIYRF